MIPEKSINLLIAGRLIDADRGAFGGVRVMVNCNQMGEAAGVAAALAVQHSQTVGAIDVPGLRIALVEGGSIFPARQPSGSTQNL